MSELFSVFTFFLLEPLSLIPPGIQMVFDFTFVFFGLYVIGRLLNWLWGFFPGK